MFKTALEEAGLSYVGIENNYISSITAPEIYGGYELKEMDNGKNSGWMYTVNGVHPDRGLNEWYVTTDDEIVWHYIDDYKVEQADMKDESGFASSGNASTWNKWLEALDETPGARDNAEKVVNQIKQIDETIELTDEEEAEKVAQQINSLPEVKDLKLADKTAVEEARKAYDALSDNQKAMIEDAKTALEEKEAEIKRLEELADNTDKPDPDNKDDDKKDDNKDNNKDNNTSTTDKNNNKGSGTTTGTTNKGSNTTTGTTTNKGTQSGSTNKTTGTTTGSSQAQTSGKQGTDSSVKSAKTGDETDFLLPMAGLISASGAFAGVILYYKKRRKDTGVEKKEEK